MSQKLYSHVKECLLRNKLSIISMSGYTIFFFFFLLIKFNNSHSNSEVKPNPQHNLMLNCQIFLIHLWVSFNTFKFCCAIPKMLSAYRSYTARLISHQADYQAVSSLGSRTFFSSFLPESQKPNWSSKMIFPALVFTFPLLGSCLNHPCIPSGPKFCD